MLKYRIIVWLAVVAVGQVTFWYMKSAAGVEWGTPDCGCLLGFSMLWSFIGASVCACAPDDDEVRNWFGVKP